MTDLEAPARHARTDTRFGLSVLAWIPIGAYLLVAYVYRNGSGAIVRQHDTLDFLFPVLSRASLSDLFASPNAELDFFLGGLPRGFLGSEFHVGHLLSTVLPLTAALIVTELITRTVAFVGMRLLLGRLGVEVPVWAAWVTATLFSILPFYLPAFGAVAGVPLIAWAFVRTVQDGEVDLRSGLVAGLTPTYVAGYATIPILLVTALATVLLVAPLRRAALRPAVKWMAVLGAAVAVVDWRLFWSSATGPTSHRVEMVVGRPFMENQWTPLGTALSTEVSHAEAVKSTWLGLVILGCLALAALGHRSVELRFRRLVVGLSLGVVFLAIFGVNWSWFEAEVVAAVLDDWARFQMDRVRWLEPAALYVLFALGLVAITKVAFRGPVVVARVVAVAIGLVCLLQADAILDRHAFRAPAGLTLDEYFVPDDMEAIRNAAESSGKDVVVVSVGMHPTVALHAGMTTADGYWTSYPLEYKERFRRLLVPHLDQVPADAGYFDNWGSRAYLFQQPARPPCCGRLTSAPRDLVADRTQWEPLGITHVVSTWQLSNADDVWLREVPVSHDDWGLGPLYLYEVTDVVR